MKDTFKEPYEFLVRHKVAVLSTANGKDDVWGAAIYYAVGEALTFYFFTKKGSKKYQNILENPHAALTIADDTEQASVQASGVIEEVPADEQNEAYQKLVLVHPQGEFSWKPPVSKMEGETILLKLTPKVLQYANFKSDSHDSADHITRII
ncbi:MAG TPA: pyridoxamine 5'-phosphate oxidase family protein [Candidatus Saccharimonadales bacterium]